MTTPRKDDPSWFQRMLHIGWLAPALALLTFAATYLALPFRGSGEHGIWMAEASDHILTWLRGPSIFDLDAIEAAWKHHAALPPLPILLVSLTRLIAPGLGFFGAAHFVSALSLALTIPLVWGFGRRCGGPPGAATAVFAFVLTPRILGLSGVAGFGAPAVAGLVFAAYAMYRARTSRAWAFVAPLALAVGAMTSHTTLLALIPWLLLSLSDKGKVTALLMQKGRDPDAPEGHLKAASFSPWLLLIPVLALPLCVALYPWTWLDPPTRLWAYFEHFLVHAKEPFLYMGDRVTTGRLPMSGGLFTLLVTLTPVICMMGLAGVLGEIVLQPVLRSRFGLRARDYISIQPDPEAAGPEAREAKRWVFFFLVSTLLLPWFFGSTAYGVVDLVAMSVPFWAVFAGCAFSRLFSATAVVVRQRRTRILSRVPLSLALATFGALVFVPALLACAKHYQSAEGYYSWIIGGPVGAVSLGMPRNPSGPVPLIIAEALADQNRQLRGRATMAVLVNKKPYRKVFARFEREGLVKGLPTWSDPFGADILILPHNDVDPAYYEQAPSFAASVPPKRSVVLRSDRVRIVTIGLPERQK